MTTKRRSKTIKRRTVKRGGRPPRPVMKPLKPTGSKPIHAWSYSASKHGGDGPSKLRGGKRRSRKYKFRKKKKTRRIRKHPVGKGVGKSKPIKSPSPPPSKQTRKSVQFSSSTKSASSPKTNKTKKMFISKNKDKQKAVVQYENRQQRQDLLDMSLGRIPLDGGNRVRRGKKSKRR